MDSITIAFLIGIALSIVTVFGDYLVKKASLLPNFQGIWILIIGALIYGVTAFGWFFVVRRIRLFTLGVLYAISCVVFLTLLSIFYFKERVNYMEIVGIIMALSSLVILYRFA